MDENLKVKFLQGEKERLPSVGTDDKTLYFLNDTGEIYKSIGAGIPLKDMTKYSYTHKQINPASVWNVTHKLNKLYPHVRVFVDGEEVNTKIIYSTLNLLQVIFPEPLTGMAFVE